MFSSESPSPAVSVIVATYNSAATLRSTLGSLVLQDFRDFEAWIIGDACTDDSEDVVRSFGDARLNWRNLARNSGSQSVPNNEGLRLARGRFVAYLGHDDLWLPWHLSGLSAAAAQSNARLRHRDVPDAPARWPAPGHRTDGSRPRSRGPVHAAVELAPPPRHCADGSSHWRDPQTLGCGVDLDFQRRAALAGFRFHEARRVSCLKFPSSWWHNYAPGQVHPQPDYLRRIEHEPSSLERELLQDVVARYAREENGARPMRDLRRAATALFRRIADGYGRDRWPMSAYMFWRQQRFRRHDRPRRGLPPLEDRP